MTPVELYRYCANELEFGGCGEFEAQCIFEDLLDFDKSKVLLSDFDVSRSDIDIVNNAINRRKFGEPLQYILGKWDFYDRTFFVGKGVLIPRPETELLVDFALEKLVNIKEPVIYDLCAGSGCIGLTVAYHIKNSTVFLFEKEKAAFEYLKRNKDKYDIQNAVLINDDIFTVDLSKYPQADMVLSNPPYIKTDEIEDLQKEVHFEPKTALDGGEDGLLFYRCIAERWTDKVKSGGHIAMECGEEQYDDIIRIFDGRYKEKNVTKDFNNIDRIVAFRI
ncbi:MAG: peptide chain release factor N(5)-glutamine methyltransferase [Oscillospiraceae bacterium]|nr:peptide chain release factor N(5)-glutamine methyltransferase [Oscillospiraceae bacterium]